MDRYEAIARRKSLRTYAETPLDAEQCASIAALAESAPVLDAGLPMRTHLVVEGGRIQRILSGIIGSYGKIRAPHYLVVTAEPRGRYLENVGFAMEAVVLDLTARGIGTCWIGGHINPADLYDIVTIPAGQQPVLLIALGWPAPGASPYRGEDARIARKPVRELILAGNPGATWLPILEAVRLAPSAGNSQPWRFVIADDQLHLYQAHANPLLRKLFTSINHVDLGIALCHVVAAAEALGYVATISDAGHSDRPDAAYTASVRIVSTPST